MRFASRVLATLAVCAAPLAAQVDDHDARTAAARAVAVSGTVTRTKDTGPWLLANGEEVPIQQEITTGGDGYAKFVVAGGATFEMFANTSLRFRVNAARAEDLLDLVSGRVRVALTLLGSGHARVFTPVAQITALGSANFAIATDEDETTRIDVTAGLISVQHRLLPRGDPVFVKAGDAIVVYKDTPLISRRLDRGTLYRYVVGSIVDALAIRIVRGRHPFLPGADLPSDTPLPVYLAVGARRMRALR